MTPKAQRPDLLTVEPAMANDVVRVALSGDEALVLFEFLARFCEDERLAIVDQAEEHVLWDLLAVLERELAEPFDPRYNPLLLEARARVRDSTDE